MITVAVPEMGDSITEVCILEWTSGPNTVVDVDSVVAVVETDKLSVDVRTEHAGRVVETFGEVDDTVEVGQPLYTLELMSREAAAKLTDDNDAASPPSPAPAAPATPTASAPTTATAAVEPVSQTAASQQPQHRRPLIHFRHGNRDAIDREMGQTSPAADGSGSPVAGTATVGADDAAEKPSARFAPQPLSEEEIAMIVSGGAEAWN